MSEKSLFAPLRVTIGWLAGTYLLFLVVGKVDEVDNLGWLSGFIGLTILCFAIGYRGKANHYRRAGLDRPLPIDETVDETRKFKTLVLMSGLYYMAYGVIYAREYGVANVSAVVNSVLNPGDAYFSKFDVYARQQAFGQVNSAAQILTLAAILSAPLVPFLIVYWKRLTPDIRFIGVLGLVVYAAYFLAIGTLSGLGQTIVFAGVALMVLSAQRQTRTNKRPRSIRALAVFFGVAFALYISYTQGERAVQLDATTASKYKPNPIMQAVAGEDFARGVTIATYYPTHGYQGLALNLETPFRWTHGQGASRAIDSYVAQYGLADSAADDTYPARTEARTGWPQGQLWATIYPWLASDLTWFGALGFMVLLGRWTVRWWYEAVAERSKLALLLLCQAGLLIAFIPANNQIGLSRPYTITAATLLLVYTVNRVGRLLQRKPEAPSDGTTPHREAVRA